MGFTVQLMSDGNPLSVQASTWAILLNHEHVMFVGSYQQCEDWLDWYGVEVIEGKARSPHSSGQAWKDRGRISEWFNGLTQRGIVRDVWQRTVAFLTGNSGHSGLVESIGLAITMAAVYVGVMLTTWTFAWNRAIIYDNLLRASNAPRTSLVGPVDRTGSPGDGPSLDIACDLAQ